MYDFAIRMMDDAEGLKREAAGDVDEALAARERYKAHGGLDGFPVLGLLLQHRPVHAARPSSRSSSPPTWLGLIQGYRDLGFYTIKHTDGNIMPILDQLVQANPHALHSLDPQAGVDIAEVKRLYGDRLCLIGNVNCGLLDTGTEEECVASARYCLQHGMPGGGYIFSTSNCVYTGMRLSRYELIHEVWRKEGNYA